MKKDFQRWHRKKEKIHEETEQVFFHKRQVWVCSLGVNIGFEQDGKGDEFLRPVIIFRKFSNRVFWAIPLTKSQKNVHKKAERFYFPFSFLPGIKSVAILTQIRLLDAKRLQRPIGYISEGDFKKLTKKLKELFP